MARDGLSVDNPVNLVHLVTIDLFGGALELAECERRLDHRCHDVLCPQQLALVKVTNGLASTNLDREGHINGVEHLAEHNHLIGTRTFSFKLCLHRNATIVVTKLLEQLDHLHSVCVHAVCLSFAETT